MIFDGYVRVSKLNGREGESFISPLVQREQINGWAAARGASVANVFEEFEESGGRADRPLLMEAVSRVECGLTDGIVVASLDRFGRSLLDGLAVIERIQSAGGSFVAVGDGFDLATDTGQLVMRIMLSIAEWELDRVRLQWSTARQRAVMRGLHTGRCPPVGYTHGEDRRLMVDRQVAVTIVEVFRRRAGGATHRELAELLDRRGIKAEGARWRPGGVGQILRNRVYLGELRSGDFVNRAAHEAIVEEPAWHAAQTPSASRRKVRDRRPTMLGGLLRCAGCGLVLSTRTVLSTNGRPYRVYSCNGEAAAGACPARASILSNVVEPYIDGVFFGLLWAAERRAGENPRLVALEGRLDAARAETERYRDSPRALRVLGAERFAQGLSRRVARERRLRLAVGVGRKQLGLSQERTVAQLEASWPSLSIAERRAAISQVLDAAFVLRGGRGAHERLVVCARGDAPDGMSREQRVAHPLQPVNVRELRALSAENVEASPAWPHRRINDELHAFLTGHARDDWPTADEFAHAGRGPLFRQLELTGGVAAWRPRVPHVQSISDG